MAKIKISGESFVLTEDVDFIYEAVVSVFGDGAKVGVPKKYLGKKVYVLVRKQK